MGPATIEVTVVGSTLTMAGGPFPAETACLLSKGPFTGGTEVGGCAVTELTEGGAVSILTGL